MKNILCGAVTAIAVLAACPAAAQPAFPDKPIKFIVPYPPGSGTDTIARYTAKRLESAFGKPVVIENKVGGNAIIAVQTVISSQPDGYTLLWAANGPVTTNVALYEKLPYDPLTDLEPVARVAFSPMGVYVPSSSPYKTAAELFDAARKNPNKLNYGSGSATYNIASEWLMSLVGAQANAISYKGAAPALTDLAGGQVDFAITEYSTGVALVKADKIRLLGVTSDKRMASEPNAPTMQELGYKGFFQVAWWGVFAPKGTPKPVIQRLEDALLTVYRDAETKSYLDKNNYSAFLGTAEELRRFQRSEIERESRLVRQFKIPKL
ncbi:Bug family tripartite tricarboxylate transporter substrate binding protein [Imbroritus primus]|uniref:Bug family tripartite tricarboxylate transporter substrate binding protein n=1 Tax=Imbroritus primus TaxID=3058603 RepID=UPI003D1605B2